MPTIVAPAGTSLVTTALAPTRARVPTVIGPSTCAPEPMITPSPIVGWRLPATPLSGLVPPSVTHLVDRDVVADLGGLADHDEAMVDEEVAADRRAGMDVDRGQRRATSG